MGTDERQIRGITAGDLLGLPSKTAWLQVRKRRPVQIRVRRFGKRSVVTQIQVGIECLVR